jgi:hypothetical protein
MSYSNGDYEQIGRAIVERVERSKHDSYQPIPPDLRQMVKFGPGNSTTINISVKSHCPGCGLRVTQDTRDGILEVGFEADPLKLLKL